MGIDPCEEVWLIQSLPAITFFYFKIRPILDDITWLKGAMLAWIDKFPKRKSWCLLRQISIWPSSSLWGLWNIDGSHELFVIVPLSRKLRRKEGIPCCRVICPLAAQIQQKDYSHIYYDIFHDGKLRAHVVCWAQPGQVFLWGTQWDVSRYHQILHSYRCLSSASTVPFIYEQFIIQGVPTS